MLVFRDVDIDADTQANLIRMLIGMGPLAAGESGSARANGDPFYVSNKEPDGGAPFGRLLFHSDMMWSEHTFQVLSLYGVEVEPPVSPTLFASAADAWATLPAELRAEVERRSAIQGHNEHERARAANDPDVLITTFDNLPTRTTPIKYPHPRTGAPILYVSQQMTCAVDGLAPSDSEALLEELFAHLYRAESVYEHDWRHHDLVAWDNIAVQHARPNVTVEGPVRTLRKVFAPLPPRAAKPAAPEVRDRGLTSPPNDLQPRRRLAGEQAPEAQAGEVRGRGDGVAALELAGVRLAHTVRELLVVVDQEVEVVVHQLERAVHHVAEEQRAFGAVRHHDDAAPGRVAGREADVEARQQRLVRVPRRRSGRAPARAVRARSVRRRGAEVNCSSSGPARK